MLGEWFRYITTLAPERVRKFGYLKNLIQLEFRHKKNAHAWEDHLLNASTFIVEAAERCPHKGIAVVLGSGLLLDVPLRSLAERFERVYLVDMFHMPQVRAKAKKFLNVKLLYGDITGIFAMMKEGEFPGGSVPAPMPRIPHLADADLIVSANCLTSLAPPFCKYLDRTRHLTEFDQDKLTLQIQDAHVQALAGAKKPVCAIITETERFQLSGDKVVGRTPLTPGLTFPKTATLAHNLEWQWLVSRADGKHEPYDIEHTVDTRLYERFVPGEGEEDVPEGLEDIEDESGETEDGEDRPIGDRFTKADGSLGEGLEDV